ncbi:hypothetical protein AgCh_018327 [Apium graveolens]
MASRSLQDFCISISFVLSIVNDLIGAYRLDLKKSVDDGGEAKGGRGGEKIVDPVLFPAMMVATSWRRRPVGAGEVGVGEDTVLNERD